jgi:hypothetical protein
VPQVQMGLQERRVYKVFKVLLERQVELAQTEQLDHKVPKVFKDPLVPMAFKARKV